MKLKEVIYGDNAQERTSRTCSDKRITFYNISPSSLHTGAAVKSSKHLLFKNIATPSLTWKKMKTSMLEIKSIPNSRPITPLSEDQKDIADWRTINGMSSVNRNLCYINTPDLHLVNIIKNFWFLFGNWCSNSILWHFLLIILKLQWSADRWPILFWNDDRRRMNTTFLIQ